MSTGPPTPSTASVKSTYSGAGSRTPRFTRPTSSDEPASPCWTAAWKSCCAVDRSFGRERLGVGSRAAGRLAPAGARLGAGVRDEDHPEAHLAGRVEGQERNGRAVGHRRADAARPRAARSPPATRSESRSGPASSPGRGARLGEREHRSVRLVGSGVGGGVRVRVVADGRGRMVVVRHQPDGQHDDREADERRSPPLHGADATSSRSAGSRRRAAARHGPELFVRPLRRGGRIAVELELRREPVLARDEDSRCARASISAASPPLASVATMGTPSSFASCCSTSPSSLRTMTGSSCARSAYSSVRMTSLSGPASAKPGADRDRFVSAALPVRDDARSQRREQRQVTRQHAELAVDARRGHLVDAGRERAARAASRSRAGSCRPSRSRPWPSASAPAALASSMLPTM